LILVVSYCCLLPGSGQQGLIVILFVKGGFVANKITGGAFFNRNKWVTEAGSFSLVVPLPAIESQ
jgi:hypothetical protein